MCTTRSALMLTCAGLVRTNLDNGFAGVVCGTASCMLRSCTAYVHWKRQHCAGCPSVFPSCITIALLRGQHRYDRVLDNAVL